MPARLHWCYPLSENAILGTLTATWLCKPLFSYFQSGRIWHCFLHSFPTKLAHLHIGCKCPSNDIGGSSQVFAKDIFSCWIWLLWKAEKLWVTAENTLAAPGGATTTHGWSPSNTILLLPLNFEAVYWLIIFPSPLNCCLTYLKHFNIWTLWHICCHNK